MFEVKLDQVRDDFEIKRDVNEGCGVIFFANLISMFSILIIGALTMFFLPDQKIISVVVFVFLFFVFQHFLQKHIPKLDSKWATEKDCVGNLILSDEMIYTEYSDKLEVNDIKEIELITSPYRGYIEAANHGKSGITYNGLGKIQLVMIDGSKHTFKYLMKTEDQMNNLSLVLKSWYLQDVSIKEYSLITEDRILLLRSDWTYEETQNLKKELNILSIYS